ncbi:cytochrome b/b6 domain-containing protein [Glutamicibacter uratoxydans]|uniref:cytochrome b/b6 domain-containing protein n=1 Tax=Glutamicibacter uratoxydans TaxID=43667 RepID=UPI0011428523|nr:cytochrome b/b6 domain-containing protein [Glutamicibacter uratoxydans]
MSTPTRAIRQGLPRVSGGDPWPPAIAQPAVLEKEPEAPVAGQAAAPAAEPPVVAPAAAQPAPAAEPAAAAAPSAAGIRQGLPRVPGGAPWPPAEVAASTPAAAPAPAAESVQPAVQQPVSDAVPVLPVPASTPASAPAPTGELRGDVRQGLPRVAGGDPWPPLDAFPAEVSAPTPAVEPVIETAPAPAALEEPVVAASVAAEPAAAAAPPAQQAAPAASVAAPAAKPAEKPKAAAAPAAKPEPVRHGPLTAKQWVLAGIFGAFSALGMATAVVLLARWIAGFDAVSGFIAQYPGEYHLPDSAPVGVPAWLAWNHFFNFFLMVLIIRTGLQVRHQKKPPAYWSSKRSPKVSINLWLHQSLDALWIINGLVFVVLLFATGHWMRIVPTSWEVFPNAVSAALQYLTLDWPTENGWVNYNSLQQLAYFATVFIAAPLAAVTGFRLSAFWPKNAALAKKYPIEVARALHFPTMLYFALFIVVHVILVFSTGALRNLNHMYAAQGSTDPAAYADNWAGLLFFALSLLVIAGAWIACRPIVLSMIAGVFGKVSSR